MNALLTHGSPKSFFAIHGLSFKFNIKKDSRFIMAKKKSSFFKDFRDFISRGNVVDMAVGVVIGGSFGKIVTGLVNYIINPFIGIFMKQGSLDTIKTVISEPEFDPAGLEIVPEVAIQWGTWIQTVIDFLITAFCIFVVVRVISAARNKLEAKKIAEAEAKAAEEAVKAEVDKKAAEEAAAALAEKQAALDASILKQEALLAEIRDLLKNK